MVVRVHNDSDVYDDDAELLHTHLLHICHLYCQVKGLETGYIKDVHGEVLYVTKSYYSFKDLNCYYKFGIILDL